MLAGAPHLFVISGASDHGGGAVGGGGGGRGDAHREPRHPGHVGRDHREPGEHNHHGVINMSGGHTSQPGSLFSVKAFDMQRS